MTPASPLAVSVAPITSAPLRSRACRALGVTSETAVAVAKRMSWLENQVLVAVEGAPLGQVAWTADAARARRANSGRRRASIDARR